MSHLIRRLRAEKHPLMIEAAEELERLEEVVPTSPKDAVKAVAWRAYNSNGDVLTEWVDGAPSDWDHSEVARVQGRMEIAYSELPTVMCEGRRYEVLTPRTIAHAECVRDHASTWLKNVTGVDALSQVRKQALLEAAEIYDKQPGREIFGTTIADELRELAAQEK